MDLIYLDYAATTPVHPEVLEGMLPYLREHFGNASSAHAFGRTARAAVDVAREQVAALINADPGEIVFTSGGTESDNLALRGCMNANGAEDHLVTTAIEHHAVLETAEVLEEEGKRVTTVGVDEQGIADPEAIRAAMRDDTALVSVMLANNEIGTVQWVAEIAESAHEAGAVVHTDAVQAAGRLPLNVEELGVDLLSLSAHKLYGPKGVGALYVRKGTRLGPLITGGGQEMGKRGGTENVAGIVGLGRACEIARRDMAQETPRLTRLRDGLRDGVLERIAGATYTGHLERRLPHIAHFVLDGALGETIVVALDEAGIAASAGSACSAGAVRASHVLLALGIPPERAAGSLRLSVGRATSEDDVARLLDVLPPIVERIRQASGIRL